MKQGRIQTRDVNPVIVQETTEPADATGHILRPAVHVKRPGTQADFSR